MFGSNDKNQSDNAQHQSDPLPLVMPPSDTLMASPPPDSIIAPTAPAMNTAPALASDEPVLPPPLPTPEIITTASKAKSADAPPPPAPLPEPGYNEDELINIKQQALSSLSPMVHQLDQSPEEKFKTTMMLIQASDNAALIKDAYEAANAITDEKARAQALLDVVNEINYFTQHQENNQSA